MRSFRMVLSMTIVLALATAPVLADAAGLLLNLARLATPRPGSGTLAKLDFTLDEDFGPDSIAWSPDGRYIADTGTLSSTLNIWSVAERRVIQHFESVSSGPLLHALTFSPDSKWLAFCNYGQLTVYAVADWRLAHTESKPGGSCHGRVAFSDDGKQLAVNARELVVLNTSDWSTIKTIDSAWRSGKDTEVLVFVPGTHDLVIGSGDRFPDYAGQTNPPAGGVLWVLAEGERIPGRRIPVYLPDPESHFNSDVISIAMSQSGKQLVTGARTGNGAARHEIKSAIRIIDFASGNIVASPLDGIAQSHQNGLAYSSDGRYLIVGDDNQQSPKVYLVATSNLTKIDTIELSWSARDVAANPIGNGFAVATGTRIGVWRIH